MSEFVVEVMEVHRQRVKIEAENSEEAMRKVAKGEGEEFGETVYLHTLDPDTWGIEG